MSQKKNQHIVPRTYLRSFTDSVRPDGITEHVPFEPCVWVIEKSLKSEPKCKAPGNILWKSYFYNLDEDEDASPVIEEFLMKIEGKYPQILKKISVKGVLTREELLNITLFVDTLFRRTPPSLKHWQNQINKVEELYRHVDQAYNHSQEISDQVWKGSHEMAKKQIINSAGALSSLLLKAGVVFVFNSSKLSFVSSDNPVVYQFLHIDELYELSIPKAWTYKNIRTNEKNFFCYCSLTPNIALISSPFIQLPCGWAEIDDPNFSFKMNMLTHIKADSVLISNQSKPYGLYQNIAIQYLESIQDIQPPEGIRFLIYTNKARYDLKVDAYRGLDTHPIQPEVYFWTRDLETLHAIAQDDVIEFVHCNENIIETGNIAYWRLQSLRLRCVSLHPDEPSVMKGFCS
jgi:Protein of unknown function (DUF4238)